MNNILTLQSDIMFLIIIRKSSYLKISISCLRFALFSSVLTGRFRVCLHKGHTRFHILTNSSLKHPSTMRYRFSSYEIDETTLNSCDFSQAILIGDFVDFLLLQCWNSMLRILLSLFLYLSGSMMWISFLSQLFLTAALVIECRQNPLVLDYIQRDRKLKT